MNVPKKIIVHHSASSPTNTSLSDINEWHRQRDFTKSELGFFVGYHFVIFPNGTVVRTRSDDEVGCHCIGQNFSSLGVCLVGNFDKDFPTIAQQDALGVFLVEYTKKYNIGISSILPHRAFSNTNCYGIKLDNQWAQRILLQQQLSTIKKLLLWLQMQIH